MPGGDVSQEWRLLSSNWVQVNRFAVKYQGTYMDSELPGLMDHGKHYPSSNHLDELAWGNLWLYFATAVSPHAHLTATIIDSILHASTSPHQVTTHDTHSLISLWHGVHQALCS